MHSGRYHCVILTQNVMFRQLVTIAPSTSRFSVYEILLSCSRVAACIQTDRRTDVAKLVGAFCNL